MYIYKGHVKQCCKMYLQADYTAIAQKTRNLEIAKETCAASVEAAYINQYFENSKLNHPRFKDDLYI